MGTSVKLSDQEHEELRLLYTVSVADIVFFKQQQWAITNYAVALYVAFVITAKQLLSFPEDWTLIVLCVFSIGVGAAAIGLGSRLQHSIELRRTRLEAIRGYFSEHFATAWQQAKIIDDVLLMQRTVVVLGAVFAVWTIWVER